MLPNSIKTPFSLHNALQAIIAQLNVQLPLSIYIEPHRRGREHHTVTHPWGTAAHLIWNFKQSANTGHLDARFIGYFQAESGRSEPHKGCRLQCERDAKQGLWTLDLAFAFSFQEQKCFLSATRWASVHMKAVGGQNCTPEILSFSVLLKFKTSDCFWRRGWRWFKVTTVSYLSAADMTFRGTSRPYTQVAIKLPSYAQSAVQLRVSIEAVQVSTGC